MTTSPVEFALAFSAGLVAFTFALSGITKVGRSAETLRAMVALQVPVVVRRLAIARLVPIAEIVLALLLLTLPGALLTVVGVVAASTLAVFTVLLAGALRRGDTVDCGCFGVLSIDRTVTGWSIVRNVVLLAAAVVVAVFGNDSPGFIESLAASDLSTVLALGLTWSLLAIAVLLRALLIPPASIPESAIRATSRRRTDAVPPLSPVSIALGIDPSRPGEVFAGDPIPSTEVVSATGITQTLVALASGGPAVLFFLSAGCGSCTPVADAIPGWSKSLAPVPLFVVTSSTPSELDNAYPGLASHARFGALSALSALGVQRSPAAVVLSGADRIIASPITYGIAEIEGLIASMADARSTRPV